MIQARLKPADGVLDRLNHRLKSVANAGRL